MNVTTSPSHPCYNQRYWYYFLTSTIIAFTGGITLTLLCKGLQKITNCSILRNPCYLRVKRGCQFLVSGRTLIGRILISTSCCFSIGSLIIYLVEASQVNREVESCWTNWKSRNPVYFLDFCFNIFFLTFFFIKFLAVDDKFMFWFKLNAFVDYCTIPPSFVSMALQRQWLGLRFMRAFRIMSIPDMLQYLKILKSVPVIRFAKLLSMLTSTIIAAAGFIQLLEISGDWFFNNENARAITYWESLYLVVVTMSTVGYGDITCKTVSGRIFICFFILTALASFASLVPEIAELIGNRKRRFKTSFQVEAGVNHIVVCGDLTYHTLHNFLRDFLHEDRRKTKMTKVVVMDNKQLTLDIEALLKGYFTRVVHVKGSPLRVEDLRRAKLLEADACVIMANQKSSKPDVDDLRNIMKAISIKNFSPTRIIIQLLRSHSMIYLESLPRWDKYVDKIVCLSQIKLGIMAAGCLTPGFSTLLANLVFTSDIKTHDKEESWFSHYSHGASMEIYRNHFSQSFIGMSFEEAVKICYTKLNLMLIGISNKEKEVTVNPSKSNVSIKGSSYGLFICQQEGDVQKVLDFCLLCHFEVENEKLIKKCQCSVPPRVSSNSEVTVGELEMSRMEKIEMIVKNEENNIKFRTGSETILEMNGKVKEIKDHIVVCPGKSSKFVEVKDFIKQINAAKCSESLDIVSFLEESDASTQDWERFCTDEGVILKAGTPLSYNHLKDIHVERCKICVILSGLDDEENDDEDAHMDADVHAILTTLYARSTIKDILRREMGYVAESLERPMILTEIAHESNVMLIGRDYQECKSLHLSKSFASGQVFSTSVLDALISTIYCNPGAFSFIKALMNMEVYDNAYKSETLLLSVENTALWKNKGSEPTFRDLFLSAMEENGILCLGLYRHFEVYTKSSPTGERFVITTPPGSLSIHPSDLVYCLVPAKTQRLIGNQLLDYTNV